LATYLTVIARRVIIRELLQRKTPAMLNDMADVAADQASPEERIDSREDIERLLRTLHGPEADIVRMYHLEGKSYREISTRIGMPENSIGPTLSRARAKLREATATGRND
jgi:RNA polymerase sigma-70 factor (ECF subfamily)